MSSMDNPMQMLNTMNQGVGSTGGLGSFGGQSPGSFSGLGATNSGLPSSSNRGGFFDIFKNFFGFGKGNKDQIEAFNKFTPEQMKLINDILSRVSGQTGNAFDYINSILSNDPKAMAEFEKPTIDQFNQQVVPGILERFTGQGARSSSATNQTLGQAGRQLSSDLAAQRANLKSGAINQLMNFLNTGLTQTQGFNVRQGQEGLLQMLMKILGGR